METRHIRFLREVADSGSISAASRRLGITQSALTKIVARVEDELGAKLFDRTGRGVEPNAYGQVFLNRTRRIDMEVEDLISDMRAMSSGLAGTVEIGSGEVWIRDILPVAIAKSHILHPKLDIRVRTSPFEDLMSELWRGELDFVLAQIRPDLNDEDVTVEPIRDTVLMLTVRRDHPLARGNHRVTAKALSDHHWALAPPGDPARDHIMGVLNREGVAKPSIAVETSSFQLLARLLLHSDMMALLPDVRNTVYAEELTVLDADWCTHRRPAGIVTLRRRELTAAVNNFLDILREEARLSEGRPK